jgi:homoserine dehydrogenase
LRLLVTDQPGVFAQITRALGDAQISLASVIQKQSVEVGDPPTECAEIVLMTHRAQEAAMQRAVRAVAELPVVREVGSLIRVEG